MAKITRLSSGGYGTRLTGLFTGRVEVTGPITRLGSAGYGVKRTGDFTGRVDGGSPAVGLFNYPIYARKRARR